MHVIYAVDNPHPTGLHGADLFNKHFMTVRDNNLTARFKQQKIGRPAFLTHVPRIRLAVNGKSIGDGGYSTAYGSSN